MDYSQEVNMKKETDDVSSRSLNQVGEHREVKPTGATPASNHEQHRLQGTEIKLESCDGEYFGGMSSDLCEKNSKQKELDFECVDGKHEANSLFQLSDKHEQQETVFDLECHNGKCEPGTSEKQCKQQVTECKFRFVSLSTLRLRKVDKGGHGSSPLTVTSEDKLEQQVTTCKRKKGKSRSDLRKLSDKICKGRAARRKRKGGKSSHIPLTKSIKKKCEQPEVECKQVKSGHSSMEPLKCPQCDKTFSAKCYLNRHAILHNDDRKFKCSQCDKSYRDSSNLKKHKGSQHEGGNLFCSICGLFKRTANNELVQTHTSEHQEIAQCKCKRVKNASGSLEYQFQCPLCDKKFHTKYHLRRHEIVHTDSRPFKCSFCNKSFRDESNLREHQKAQHMGGQQKFTCSICSRSYTRNRSLTDHMRNHTGEKPYSCNICDQSFSQRGVFRTHMATHSDEAIYPKATIKIHQCTICAQIFTRNYTLVNHMRTHTGEKPFMCSICAKCYSLRADLVKHERTHTGERPFKCNVCEKTFAHKAYLRKHMQTHTGNKRFKCSVCEKSFFIHSTLKEHLMTHTMEKPFKCSTCEKSFARKTNLTTHMRTHTGEKPYNCPICEKPHNNKSNLNAHIRKHTG